MFATNLKKSIILLCIITASISLTLYGCGGGGGGGEDVDGAAIVVTPDEITAYRGETVTVRVDVENLPEGEGLTGYSIDWDEAATKIINIELSEETTGINIVTEECDPGTGTDFCKTWSITPGTDTVPTRYFVEINAVGEKTTPIWPGYLTIKVDYTATYPAVSIAAGDTHSLAVLTDGSVWGWGTNEMGQLGLGINRRYEIVPVPVEIISQNARAIAAGDDHSLALLEDGTVLAWGSNEYGQLGIGTAASIKEYPVQVPDLTGVKAIAAGYTHSLALLDDGTVRIWGYLADLDKYNCSYVIFTHSRSPVQVPHLDGVVQAIAGGFQSSWFLMSDGTVWAWGLAYSTKITEQQTDEDCAEFYPTYTTPLHRG